MMCWIQRNECTHNYVKLIFAGSKINIVYKSKSVALLYFSAIFGSTSFQQQINEIFSSRIFNKYYPNPSALTQWWSISRSVWNRLSK